MIGGRKSALQTRPWPQVFFRAPGPGQAPRTPGGLAGRQADPSGDVWRAGNPAPRNGADFQQSWPGAKRIRQAAKGGRGVKGTADSRRVARAPGGRLGATNGGLGSGDDDVQAHHHGAGRRRQRAAISRRYASADEAREAAKALMHEHQRVVRVMIVEEPSRFVEWMDRS